MQDRPDSDKNGDALVHLWPPPRPPFLPIAPRLLPRTPYQLKKASWSWAMLSPPEEPLGWDLHLTHMMRYYRYTCRLLQIYAYLNTCTCTYTICNMYVTQTLDMCIYIYMYASTLKLPAGNGKFGVQAWTHVQASTFAQVTCRTCESMMWMAKYAQILAFQSEKKQNFCLSLSLYIYIHTCKTVICNYI